MIMGKGASARPPYPVCIFHGDLNLKEEILDTKLTGSCYRDVTSMKENSGSEPNANPCYYLTLKAPRPSRTEERDHLNSTLKITQQQEEELDKFSSKMSHVLVDELDMLLRELPITRRGRFPNRSNGTAELLVNTSAKLAMDNIRPKVLVDVTRTERGRRRDKLEHILETLKECNTLLRQRRSAAENSQPSSVGIMTESSVGSSFTENEELPSRHYSMGRNSIYSTDDWTTAEEDSEANNNGVVISRAAHRKPMELVWIKESKRKSTNRAANGKNKLFLPFGRKFLKRPRNQPKT